jgi:hypothetical protein
MADKKISALTGATTPLDGTEVLPIVQSGATVKVANNDLRPKQIQSNATSGVLQVAGPGAATTRVMTTPNANFTAARTDAAQTFTGNQTFDTSMALSAVDPDFTYTRYKTSTTGGPFFTMQRSRGASAGVNTIVQGGDWLGGIIWQGANGTGYSDAAYLYATVNGTPGASGDMPGAIRMATSADGSASPTTRLDIGADGNVTVSTGNLVIGTSGKGIDFSATAGTGTSELLADYEEGLLTATVTPSTSGTVTLSGSNNTLQYTKVGRLVTVSGQLSVSSVSSPVGYAAINLPFTISDLTNTAGRSGASVMMDGTVSAVPNAFFGIGVEGTSEFRIYVANTGTSVSATAANQMQTNTAIWINFSYVA